MKKFVFILLSISIFCHYHVNAQNISFTKHRSLTTIPYFCDFEDSVENANWNTPVNASIPPYCHDKWYIGTYVSYSGAQSMYVTYNDGATNIDDGFDIYDRVWAYREFYIDTLYPQYNISFKHRGYEHCMAFFGPPDNSPFNSVLSIISTPEGAIRLSDSQSLPQDSIWMEHNYTFSVDTPGFYRLYFSWYTVNNNNRPGASIDDISITGVYCLPPNTLTTSNITDSSATLSWQHNCVNSPMAYVVGYKTAGDYDYTEITVYDTNAVTLTGLTNYTTYYWRVKALYNDSVSTDWSSVANFQTDLIWVHPLPYTCDFEDAAEVLTWNVPAISGSNVNRWYIGHNTYNSANTSLYVTTNANGSNNTYNNQSETQIWTYRDLYLDPQFPGYELSFDAKVCGYPDYAFAQVFVGEPIAPTDSLAADNMVLIDSEIGPTGGPNTATWMHFDYTLDSSFAGHKRLFFMWQTHSIGYRYTPAIAIDNISISTTNCSRPLQLVSAATDTTVCLSWQNVTVGLPENYTVAYKAETDSVYILIETSDTSLTLAGLQPLTHYTWKVRSNCSIDEHSEWSQENSFHTFQLLATMPYAYGFEDSLENNAWMSYYESSQHKWCIGNAVQHNGQYASYISKDNGATYETNNPNYAKAYLYRDFFFDPTYDEYVLEFDFMTFDNTNQTDISVYIESPSSPDFAIPNMESLVESINYTDTLWHHISFTINRTHSGTQRLVFEWTKQAWNVAKGSCAVDDISFTPIAFGRPYALTASNIDHHSALLTWESGNRNAPSSYQLAYRQANDTAYTIITLTDTVWQATMLTHTTSYHWKVRAVANNGELSAWSNEAIFFTAASIPYYTGFEDDTEYGGWYVASVSNQSDTWIVGNAVSFDGDYSIYISNDDGATNSSMTMYINDTISVYRDIFFTPGEAEYQIMFDYLGMGAEIQLQSLENTSANNVFTATIPTSDNWQHHHFSIDSSFAGFNRLFFKRLYGERPNKAGAVDNFAVNATVCPPPTSHTTMLTAPNAAHITWNEAGGSAYQVSYRIQSAHNGMEVNVQDTFLLISNLQPDALYFWKVRTQCNGVYGDWSSEYPFYTTPLLPYFCDFEDSIEISHWTYDAASSWNYWAINAAPIDNGNVSLHVGSAALGEGNYNYYATAKLWAYRDIYFGGGNSHYQLSFDYRGLGQADVDFARVYLGPPAISSGLNVPEGAEQIGDNLCMVPSWTHYSFEIDSTHTGLQRVYFQWRCDGSLGLNPGAAFDNITVQVSDCAIPVNPETISTTATTATLKWSPDNPSALPLNYTVAYRLLDDSVFTEVTSNDTILQITGLQADSYYYWMVRANCSSTDSSLWSESHLFATTQITPATTPYVCDFEDASENAAWSNLHVTGPSKWVVGTAEHLDGNYGLYVSDNDGVTCSYTNNVNSTDWVYRDIYLQPGNEEYEISFDFKGMGTNYHYARVFLGIPTVMFNSFLPENAEPLGESLYNVANWQHYSFLLDSTHAGMHRLYVLWQNNTYSATQPPAAFDNFVIRGISCREPINLISEATSHSANLSWTIRQGGAGEEYTVAYRPQNDTAYTSVTVSDTTLLLQNLNSNLFYFWKVRHNCDTSYSLWSEEKMFYTSDNLLYSCNFDTPGSNMGWETQSSTSGINWHVGRYDASKPNGTLYVSADGGHTNSYNTGTAVDLWAYTDVYFPSGHADYYLSFDFKGKGESNYDYMNVYVGQPALPSGSATPTGATVLAQKICNKNDWTHYTLTIDSTFTGLQRIYFLWHNDNSSGANPPASIDNVTVTREVMTWPDVLQVYTYDTMATVIWSISDTEQPVSYTLAYAALAVDSMMTEITLQDTTYTISDLLPHSNYLCMVRANYADGNHSLWHMTQFSTQYAYARTPYFCDFEDPTENESWQFAYYGNVNKWVMDTAATNGNGNSLYISNNGGISNVYTFNATTTAWAYRDIYLDPAQNSYQISFDFRGEGESIGTTVYDYAKVFIGVPVTPATGSSYPVSIPEGAVQIGDILYQCGEWTSYIDTIDSELTGYLRLFILWRNDSMDGNNPAAAFDNISIVPIVCEPPISIIIDSLSYTEVSFQISDSMSNHHYWDVTIVADGDNFDESLALTLHDTLSYTFTQLDSGTVYTLYARTRCDEDDYSEWITYTFSTLMDTTHQGDSSNIARYQLAQTISLYPNPTSHYLDVRSVNDVNILYVEVYDMYGKLVLRSDAEENPKRIQVSGFASGVYLMRVITNQGIVTKQFVRK